MRFPPKVEIHASRHNWLINGVSLLITLPGWQENGNRHAVQGLEFVETKPGESIGDSAILSHESAQALLNQLWVLGYRPNDGTGSTGQLQATQSHLKDMRHIAFAKLGLKDFA